MEQDDVQLMMTQDGDLTSASSRRDGLFLSVIRDVTETGTRATLAFSEDDSELLTVMAELTLDAEGSIAGMAISARGDGLSYTLGFDFAEDPRLFVTGGKLQASIEVDVGDGEISRGHFDGETWAPIGLEGVADLPTLLDRTLGKDLASLRPALDSLMAVAGRKSEGVFPATPGQRPTLPPPAEIEAFSIRGKICRAGCAIAGAGALTMCCGPSAGAGCAVCGAAVAAAVSLCTDHCPK